MTELENALEQLEAELGIVRPLGGMGLPFGLRYKAVLEHVQGKLCPRANDIRANLQRPGTDIVTIIADTIASEITSTPFVFTTLARYVVLYGLEKFCADPASIERPPVQEQGRMPRRTLSREEEELLEQVALGLPAEMAWELIMEILLHDLGEQVNVSQRPYHCPSVTTQVADEQSILKFTLEWAGAQFEIPRPLNALRPFVSEGNFYPNAFAHVIAGQAFIGMHVGLMYAISDACSSVVHHHQFAVDLLGDDLRHRVCSCTHCGGPRSLDTVYTDYSWLTGTSADAHGYWAPLMASTIATPRAVVGGMMMMMCLQWVAGHELGHVLLRHLEWRPQTCIPLWEATPPRDEGLLPSDSPPPYTRSHFMELEADLFATRFAWTDVLGLRKNLATRMENARAESTYDGAWPTDLDGLTDVMLYVVPSIMGGIFTRASRRGYWEWSREHPSAGMRDMLLHEAMLDSAPEYGRRIGALTEEQWWHRCRGSVYSIFEHWNGNHNPSHAGEEEAKHVAVVTRAAVEAYGMGKERLRRRAPV